MATHYSPPPHSATVIANVIMLWMMLICVNSRCTHNPIIFNFGDSNSDTGGFRSGLGFPVNLPNGRSFFNRSTGRLSDGRLIIDFLGQSLNASLLRPYLDPFSGSKFTNGANFAVSGSATLPKNEPFSLNIQVMQFCHFKLRLNELATTVAGNIENLISDNGFRSALYVIDIGQNDISSFFSSNISYEQVVRRIPKAIEEIRKAVETIHGEGGRRFWIHNTGPLGCLPKILELNTRNSTDLDEHGCLSTYNSAATFFNQQLSHLCQDLIRKYKDVTIVYVDIYAIKYGLISNSHKLGFSSPLSACCGSGKGAHNFSTKVTCGQSKSGFKVCNEKSKYVNWDGTHYTEAANSFVASKILSKSYSTPNTAFDFFCQGIITTPHDA